MRGGAVTCTRARPWQLMQCDQMDEDDGETRGDAPLRAKRNPSGWVGRRVHTRSFAPSEWLRDLNFTERMLFYSFMQKKMGYLYEMVGNESGILRSRQLLRVSGCFHASPSSTRTENWTRKWLREKNRPPSAVHTFNFPGVGLSRSGFLPQLKKKDDQRPEIASVSGWTSTRHDPG